MKLAKQKSKLPLARGIRLPGNAADSVRAINKVMNGAFNELTDDLNQRLRLAGYDLAYHNGLIQQVNDQTIGHQIEKPFWALVGKSPWGNVDHQMKEAIDCRDNGDRMAAFHAVSALESCIKIICHTKGWSTGMEKGANDFLNHLEKKTNGPYIEPWERKQLSGLFSDVRNPFAHGAGPNEMPNLTGDQTSWTIETSMSWIKSLVSRL
ncbi:hypothetical protein GOZ94_11170 [Agrobacterium vitis]|nr:hypothetical protein [Agrobacterium vitis]